MHFLDVHCHLTHERFAGDLDAVVRRAQEQNLSAIVVNGLEPQSNREILKLAATYSIVKPAMGIYPTEAVNSILPEDFPHPVKRFDVWGEIEFIRQQAQAGAIVAIGECGLDGYWLQEETFSLQEKVFAKLIEVAMETNKPLIVHSRKLEQRVMDIIASAGVKKVNFHCYSGKTKRAQEGAEKYGWWFSIPANAHVNEAFAKMLKILPKERILTETDAPYLGPKRGERNEPANVVGTVQLLAGLRGWSLEQARDQVWANYLELFS